ncbi:MAG: 4-carboxymuconolactone decarboxylase [Pseudonocardiales bacterium]|uniref:carboxymuconolactone decarboxylase family protein n=1 Tax=Pseudonocardia sp. TaxID=60912 RepID=UPI002638224E|nr:carboxymuconolactone decarboxylase family protein [Pseudonocardia sp.]MCW2719807.1 carboxymuconolactone decarboxylase [Pseudonocardia sp.]MDT7710083.1 4-carboxymuconolactone decarboxylase [Pseudonocardiales bacterium]
MNAPRLERLRPDELDADQRRLYEEIVGGPRSVSGSLVDEAGGLGGPFNAMLLSPPVGDAVQALGAALRYRSALPDRAREMATLLVAHHCSSAYEWTAHEEHGRRAGLSDEEIASLRTARPMAADDVESAVVRCTRALLDTGDLDDALYAEAVAVLGRATVFELVTLVGYYRMLAGVLATFRVPGR